MGVVASVVCTWISWNTDPRTPVTAEFEVTFVQPSPIHHLHMKAQCHGRGYYIIPTDGAGVGVTDDLIAEVTPLAQKAFLEKAEGMKWKFQLRDIREGAE